MFLYLENPFLITLISFKSNIRFLKNLPKSNILFLKIYQKTEQFARLLSSLSHLLIRVWGEGLTCMKSYTCGTRQYFRLEYIYYQHIFLLGEGIFILNITKQSRMLQLLAMDTFFLNKGSCQTYCQKPIYHKKSYFNNNEL